MTAPAPRAGAAPARWRFLAPNAITSASLVFGMLALESAVRGRLVAAAWWGLYCTLTDKLDGACARALGASSAFGMQLDSLADLTSFGVVPPVVLYAFFRARPALGWAHGPGGAALVLLSCAWLIGAATRLARFNVEGSSHGHFRGTPSTMTAGIVLASFLAVLKYSDPRLVAPEHLDALRLLGTVRADALVPLLPLLLGLGALGMVSPLRVPRLGRTRSRATDVLLFGAVAVGYGLGLFHRLPEYLAGGGLAYLIVTAAHHLRTRAPARAG